MNNTPNYRKWFNGSSVVPAAEVETTTVVKGQILASGSTPVEIGVINPDVDAYYREYTIACNPHICVKGEGTDLD